MIEQRSSHPSSKTNDSQISPLTIQKHIFSPVQQNNFEKPLPQTPKTIAKNKFVKPDSDHQTQTRQTPEQFSAAAAAPKSVRVMDIVISPKSPSSTTKRKGNKYRSNKLNEFGFEDNLFTSSHHRQKSIKRRSSSISSFSSLTTEQNQNDFSSKQKDTFENGKELEPSKVRRNRRSTMSYDQNCSYLTLQVDDDKENERVDISQTVSKAKGTWAGWMRGGQLLRPKMSKDSDLTTTETNKAKTDSTNQDDLESVRGSLRTSHAPNSNKQRYSRHQRSRASTSTTFMSKDDDGDQKRSMGHSKKWGSSHFKSPPMEGKATFGRQKKRASIGAILAPAFEQQNKRVNSENEEEENLSPFVLPKYESKKSQDQMTPGVKSENNKKTPIPKRDLATIFEKHSKSNISTASMSETKTNVTVNNCLQEPFGSQPILQATLTGLGIFGTPPNNMKETKSETLSAKQHSRNMTPARSHLSPLAGIAMNVTPQSASGDKALPKIVITPPVQPRHTKRAIDGTHVESTAGFFKQVSLEKDIQDNLGEDHTLNVLPLLPVENNQNDSSNIGANDDESTWVPHENEMPSFEVQERRAYDDMQGINRIKLVIDAYLSDFFVERPVDHVKRLLPGLTDLIQSHLDPEGSFELRSWGRHQPIPSLCALCTVQEGNEVITLHPRWVRWKMQCSMDIILDHIITGVIALIADDRAPYSTPPTMASLIESLREGLTNPNQIHFGNRRFDVNDVRNGQENALGTWVQMCAMAVGLGGGQLKENATVAEMTQMKTLKNEERIAWRLCLDGIEPSKRLLVLLRRHIGLILDRGKATRERSNLLVVPPMQRGSRKRWLAANAEHQARRASHDENFAKLTSGQISESEYRSTERRLAATGHPKDMFAALNLVRLVGELYKVAVISVIELQEWLNRLLFDTVFPGVPSLYELEAGCALLLTVGRTIEMESGKRTGSSSPESVQSPSFLRMDVASSPTKPSFDISMKNENVDEKNLPWTIIIQCIGRLQEIQQIEEVHEDGKIWCREMVGMHQRGWQRAAPSKTQMNTISSAAQAARRARRGSNRGRQQLPQHHVQSQETQKTVNGKKTSTTSAINTETVSTTTSTCSIILDQEQWNEDETQMKEGQEEACERSTSSVTVHNYKFDIRS